MKINYHYSFSITKNITFTKTLLNIGKLDFPFFFNKNDLKDIFLKKRKKVHKNKKKLSLIIVMISLNFHSPILHAKVKRHQKQGDVGSKVITEALDNSFGYDAHDVNFTSEKTGKAAKAGEMPSRKHRTNKTIVLVNSHGSDELYLGPKNSGAFTPGKHRSLSWACTLEEGDKMIRTQNNIHDSLALPLEWSNYKHRTHVTFTIIPAGSEIEFKKGEAAPQQTKDGEFRPGGGQQIRMKHIPEGSVTITQPLLLDRQMSKQKGEKDIKLRSILQKGITRHNETNPTHEIDPNIVFDSYDNNHFENSLEETSEDLKINVPEKTIEESTKGSQKLKEERPLSLSARKRREDEERKAAREKAHKQKEENISKLRERQRARSEERMRHAW